MKVDKHPVPLWLGTASRPNGHIAKLANFNVWNPNGIPMIVIINKMLAIKYSMATHKPPNKSQIIFPNIFINCNFVKNCLFVTYVLIIPLIIS